MSYCEIPYAARYWNYSTLGNRNSCIPITPGFFSLNESAIVCYSSTTRDHDNDLDPTSCNTTSPACWPGSILWDESRMGSSSNDPPGGTSRSSVRAEAW